MPVPIYRYQKLIDVWKLILKFHDFWTTVKPILIESEIHLFSDQYKFAGTCDLVVEIEGERWLLDLKTSNSIHTAMDLQLAAGLDKGEKYSAAFL